mmetsp:Transcript_64848/g.131770  ORF Transcript_64848/g.131770 Transcript_64848/m.131770 type:complete len:89 (-) Transcript_64848:92-358(-)
MMWRSLRLLLALLPVAALSSCCSNCEQCSRHECLQTGGQWFCQIKADARKEHLAERKRLSSEQQMRRINRLVALLGAEHELGDNSPPS